MRKKSQSSETVAVLAGVRELGLWKGLARRLILTTPERVEIRYHLSTEPVPVATTAIPQRTCVLNSLCSVAAAASPELRPTLGAQASKLKAQRSSWRPAGPLGISHQWLHCVPFQILDKSHQDVRITSFVKPSDSS